MRWPFKILLLPAVVIAGFWVFTHAASFLIIDRPVRSDAILVLDGDDKMVRYSTGVQLLRAGYAHMLFVDAASDYLQYGRTEEDWAKEFVAGLPSDLKDRVQVCGIHGDSTETELRTVPTCLRRVGARSVLIVTSDFHTRRSIDVAKHVLPEYQWSVAAARTKASEADWWHSRWALKYVVLDYEKLIWWKLVDSHR